MPSTAARKPKVKSEPAAVDGFPGIKQLAQPGGVSRRTQTGVGFPHEQLPKGFPDL